MAKRLITTELMEEDKKIEEYNVKLAKKVLELFQEKISQSKLLRLF